VTPPVADQARPQGGARLLHPLAGIDLADPERGRDLPVAHPLEDAQLQRLAKPLRQALDFAAEEPEELGPQRLPLRGLDRHTQPSRGIEVVVNS